MNNDTDTKIMLKFCDKPTATKALAILWFVVWRGAIRKLLLWRL